jgi:hypothetical protein
MRRRLDRLAPKATASAVAAALLAVLVGGCGSSDIERRSSASSLAPIHGRYSPTIDPADFVAKVDNRFWPLEPRTAFHELVSITR